MVVRGPEAPSLAYRVPPPLDAVGMATLKAKKGPAPKAATRKPKTPSPSASTSKEPNRTRPIQVLARLSASEKQDLDEVVARWEAAAADQGFSGQGFADWLRAIIRREKKAAAQ